MEFIKYRTKITLIWFFLKVKSDCFSFIRKPWRKSYFYLIINHVLFFMGWTDCLKWQSFTKQSGWHFHVYGTICSRSITLASEISYRKNCFSSYDFEFERSWQSKGLIKQLYNEIRFICYRKCRNFRHYIDHRRSYACNWK